MVHGLHAEAHAAMFVDLQHLDLDHVALGQLVAHVLDALVGDLGDMHQVVLTGQDIHGRIRCRSV